MKSIIIELAGLNCDLTCLFSLYLYLAHNSWKSHGGVSNSHCRTTAANDQMSENKVGLSPENEKKEALIL